MSRKSLTLEPKERSKESSLTEIAPSAQPLAPDEPLARSSRAKNERQGARPSVWAPSSDVASGIAQIQKTVSSFKRQYFEKVELVDEEGNPLGEEVYNYAPKSYLLIGTLAQFDTGHGLNKEKYSSFQLLRRSITDPEILTFDELYERAAAIVGHSEKSV